jgi:CrcB protein
MGFAFNRRIQSTSAQVARAHPEAADDPYRKVSFGWGIFFGVPSSGDRLWSRRQRALSDCGGAMRNLIQAGTTFLIPYVAIGMAASVGAILRYVVGVICGRLFGTWFPFGTFVINLSACIFIGWFLTITQSRMTVSDTLKIAVAVGFIGTYSTFSTFAYESNALLQEGAGIKALVYMLGSLLGGLVAVRVGIALANS